MDPFLDLDQTVKVKITRTGVKGGKPWAKGLIQAGSVVAESWVNPLHVSEDTICENKKYKVHHVKSVEALTDKDIKYRAYVFEDKEEFSEQKELPKRYRHKRSTQDFLKSFAAKARIKSHGHYQVKAVDKLVEVLIHDEFLERFESYDS